MSRFVQSMKVMKHAATFLLPPSAVSATDRLAQTYSLVVLNQQIPKFTPLLWSHAKLRICADGGANRIFDDMPKLFPDQNPLNIRHRYVPNVIKGDMDSLRPEVGKFYSGKGSEIVDRAENQDTTDLHKCISFIREQTPACDHSNLCILVTGALGGRFDHEAANLNVLYVFSDMRIVLLSDDCQIRLLPKAHQHEIHIQSSVEGPHCGLFPIGGPSVSTTTTGLTWDLCTHRVHVFC
ncbi:thiamine pyrophosphokinase 1 isoform X2 [Carex littledalei]|uniref:Thiamine pyrophosphokinase n=1 Tax=Carex littledalei TaxID=544730 RepID=A0A833QMN0_9POAL|nr:thiamine pyrophosphokinase 1 isoform X2 [Carex littledalei]